ncbi:hypothetical protein M3Y94_01093300 [Aphelenchoides besseyi]|nr:hypothetical protein M3Y94_01093300 [Aphelenchoides besseyi]
MLLILAAFKTAGRKLPSYSYLFIGVGIFDGFFAFTEFATQHQLIVKSGIMYVLPRGLEQRLSPSLYPIFALPHGFVTMHGLFIFGALYKFRHDILTRSEASLSHLLSVLALTIASGMFTGISLVVAIYQTKERGDEFYISQLNENWRQDNDLKYFMYAVDIRDIGAMGFFYGGLVFAFIWVTVAAFYTYKAWKFVNATTAQPSKRTIALQRQFTLSLIVQTVNAFLFAVIPVALICFSIIFRLDGDFIGTCTLLPLSWLPFVNSALTIFVVKAYRVYVTSLFSCTKRVNDGNSGSGKQFNANAQTRWSSSHSEANGGTRTGDAPSLVI